MAERFFPDGRFFDEDGHLYPYDLRYDPDERACCDPLPDGRVRFRLMAEPGFTDARIVLADGTGLPMTNVLGGGRFEVWEVVVVPPTRRFSYSFALRWQKRRAVYLVPAGVSNGVERLDRWTFDLDRGEPFEVPGWMRGAIMYQVFPDRFHNGDPSLSPDGVDSWGSAPHPLRHQGGDLVGLAAKVGYLAELGVDVVYVNPIFTSPSNHKYDTVDYYQVDPHLGGDEALRSLIGELHRRDMRLIVDASFDHCHPRFFAFADLVAQGRGSRFRDWFAVRDFPPRVRVRPHRVALLGWNTADYMEYLRDLEEQSGIEVEEVAGDGPPVEPSYECWYGVPSMARVNLANEDARRYFLEVATYWVREFGIDGWRMDVARYVDADFWADFRRAVKAANPDTYLMAEVIGDASAWLQGDRFDATMNYTFRDLCLDYFAAGVSTTAGFIDGFNRMLLLYGPRVTEVNQNLLSSHDTPRLLHMTGGDAVKARLATAFQLLAPGAPGLYYGDEVGMTGGEEPQSRGGFPWHDEASWNRMLLDTVRQLTRLRRSHPALRYGDFRFVAEADDAFAFTRSYEQERLLVVVNRGAALPTFELPLRSRRPLTLWGPGRVGRREGVLLIEDVGPLTATVILL